jgi:hypothetical protein
VDFVFLGRRCDGLFALNFALQVCPDRVGTELRKIICDAPTRGSFFVVDHIRGEVVVGFTSLFLSFPAPARDPGSEENYVDKEAELPQDI